MRRAVRAIVLKDNKLLVMHRNKFGQEYETLPGGNIELGETAEEALFREVEEETQIKFKNPRLVFLEHAGMPYGDQYVFLCEYQSGEPELSIHSEEYMINKMGKNLYEPKWVDVSELEKHPFLSEKLRDSIIDSVKTKWPEQALEIS